MAWDDNRLVCRHCDVGVRRFDHPVDSATFDVVDERIIAVPKCVAGCQNIRFLEVHGEIPIRVRCFVSSDEDGLAIEVHGLL